MSFAFVAMIFYHRINFLVVDKGKLIYYKCRALQKTSKFRGEIAKFMGNELFLNKIK